MVIEFEGDPLALQTRDGGEVYKAKLLQGNFNDRDTYALLNQEIARFIADHPNLAGLIIDASAVSKLEVPGLQEVSKAFKDEEIGPNIKKLKQLVVIGVGENAIIYSYLGWFFNMVSIMTNSGVYFEPNQEAAEKRFRKRK